MALQMLEAASFAEKNQPASVAAVSFVVVASLSLSAPIFALNKHLQVQMNQLQVASSEHSLNNTETDMRNGRISVYQHKHQYQILCWCAQYEMIYWHSTYI